MLRVFSMKLSIDQFRFDHTKPVSDLEVFRDVSIPEPFYIQLPCGPIPATVPGIGPKTTKTIQNRYQKFSKNHTKLMPGGVPETLGEVLGPFWHQGAPEDKRLKNGLGDPPPRDPVVKPNYDFLRFRGSFSCCFLSVVLEGVRVQF